MVEHPLDKALDVDPSEEVQNLFSVGYRIPENPSMATVVNLALDQYKKIAEEALLYEPEQRVEILRLAKEYLEVAKDTMYKESDLSIKSEKNSIQRETAHLKNKPKAIGDENKDENESQEKVSYEEAMKRIRDKRRQ